MVDGHFYCGRMEKSMSAHIVQLTCSHKLHINREGDSPVLVSILRNASGTFSMFQPPDIQQMLALGLQIARGMEYLGDQHIVHRDLACRNCMWVFETWCHQCWHVISLYSNWLDRVFAIFKSLALKCHQIIHSTSCTIVSHSLVCTVGSMPTW